jgi:hypothetical protein
MPPPPLVPPPGRPGAPDLVTHLVRDHGVGFFSSPLTQATRHDGMYDLGAFHAIHDAAHLGRACDHQHVDWDAPPEA